MTHTDPSGPVPVTQTEIEAALRVAKDRAANEFGMAWHRLEEISRHELVIAALGHRLSSGGNVVAVPRENNGERMLREWRARDPNAQPEGTAAALATCAAMLETWMPECFPANEQGQVHFARCMTDATAAEIRAFLQFETAFARFVEREAGRAD